MKTASALSNAVTTPKIEQDLQPIGLRQSLFYFGIPAIFLLMAFYGFRPWLETKGYSPLTSYLAAISVPLAVMFAAALVGYHRIEGHPLNWQAFSQRIRFPRLKGKDFLWGFGIFVVGMIGYGAISRLSLLLIEVGILPLPANLPALVDPRLSFSIEALDQAAGGQIKGQWSLVILALTTFFFNIVGEELWWRGYILPRQELAFGRYAWLFHGLMWAGFHVFKWWDLLALIPVCLTVSYSAQKLKNNWPALIGHALTNFMMLPLVFGAVAGWY